MEFNRNDVDRLYMDAAGAYCAGEYEEAFVGFSRLAELGDARAITYLSELYFRGEGVSKNIEMGLDLLQRAASMGYAGAAFNLGSLYRSGDHGVPRDLEKSRKFFLLARELGCELSVEDYM